MRKIYEYCEDGKPAVTEFLKCAPPKMVKKFDFLIEQIKNGRHPLREPYVKHFMIERFKKFYELRLKSMKTMIRIIYTEADGNVILLHAFYKRNKRDTEMALEYTSNLFSRLNEQSLLPFEYLQEVNCE